MQNQLDARKHLIHDSGRRLRSNNAIFITRFRLIIYIDQSFIQKLDAHADANNEIVTQSIIALGRMLGLQVIAEGVETYSQLDFLEHHGCHAYQGY